MSLDTIKTAVMRAAEYKELLAKLRSDLVNIQQELSDIETRKADLETEAANVRAAISKLMPLCGETENPDDLSSLGITDAILRVLVLNRPKRMSANDVKEALAAKGFSLAGYSNPMASIYKILTRLKEANQIESEFEGFNVFYKAKLKRPLRRRRYTAIDSNAEQRKAQNDAFMGR